jgi:hypothetical protein
MGGEDHRHLTLLERLDLALAACAAREADKLAAGEAWSAPWLTHGISGDGLWVARVLGLRGLFLDAREAADILVGGKGRYTSAHHELQLVRGMGRLLAAVRERAATGRLPDGWFAVELFKRLTEGIARFRNNVVRRDAPWDGIAPLEYPAPEQLPGLLDRFHAAERYGEPDGFDRLHPVRQAPRVMWRFARIAPFPDFNSLMAFVVMNAYLLTKGYPLVVPQRDDRLLLNQLIAGPSPQRVIQLESRLVQQFETAANA